MEQFKIIVIDDDIGIIDTIKITMGKKYLIEGCTNPLDGIKLIKNNHFDLCILDYNMPQLDGIEFVKKVRVFNNDLNIIILTGYKDTEPPSELLEKYDIQGYHEKTVDTDAIKLYIEASIKLIVFNRKKDNFAVRLKGLRAKYKKSQQEVADAVGVTRAAINNYENSSNMPNVEVLEKLSDYFGISTDYLLCRDIRYPKVNE